eukprot:scaffold7746_cov150-Skeletonema_dohrnii-CCMP3373.AAC.1
MQFERQIQMSGSSLHNQVSHLYDAIYLNLLHLHFYFSFPKHHEAASCCRSDNSQPVRGS